MRWPTQHAATELRIRGDCCRMDSASALEEKTNEVRFQIRKAASNDKTAILTCLASAFEPFREQYTPEAYLDTVLTVDSIHNRLQEMRVYVAVCADEIIGTIACKVVGEEGHLRGMAVLPQWQRTGVALALLQRAEARLRRDHCKRVTLDTTEPLKRAVRFYEKQGFTATGRESDFFGMRLYEFVKSL